MTGENKVVIKILAHVLEDDEAIIMILEDQLRLNQVDYEIFSEDEKFLGAFHDKVHIAVIDFRPSKATALNGVQITRIIMDRNSDCRVIMITGFDSGSNKCENAIAFFHYGGFRWLFKDHEDFDIKFTEYVQDSIAFVKKEIYRKEVMEQTAGLVVRERKKLTVDENDT